MSALLKKFTFSTMMHCSVAGLPCEHRLAIGDARVLLRRDRRRDAVVARAGRDVVAIRPDRGPRVVREVRAQEFVSVVRAEWVGRRAHRVAHRVRTDWALRRACTAATAPTSAAAGRVSGRRWRRRWRYEHRLRLAWLPRHTDHAGARAVSRTEWLGLVRAHRPAREQRQNDEPAVRELIVAHHDVAAVPRLAVAREVLEHVVGRNRPEQHFPRRVVLLALLREDRDAATVHDLHDVIRADGERVVGRIAAATGSVRSFEADAETIEADHERGGWLRPRRHLLDVGGGSRHLQADRSGRTSASSSSRSASSSSFGGDSDDSRSETSAATARVGRDCVRTPVRATAWIATRTRRRQPTITATDTAAAVFTVRVVGDMSRSTREGFEAEPRRTVRHHLHRTALRCSIMHTKLMV